MSQLNAPLSQKILNEYTKLVKALLSIPVKARQIKSLPGTGGQVSASDLIAYQIGWGKLLLGWYEGGIQERPFELPGEGFTTWDYTGLARHFYIKYQYDSFLEQQREFDQVIQQIIQVVEKESFENRLDQLGVWSWCTLQSGKKWPLSKWVTVNTVSPYHKAATLIRKFAKEF